MHLLALDTTTRQPSAALVRDERVIGAIVGDASRSQAEQLPGLLLDLLAEAGVAIAEVDLFAVAAGPGAFTGLRIGIATVQGLALVHGKRVVPISALDALAHAAAIDVETGTRIGAWMDAHRRDVFASLYRVDDGTSFAAERIMELDPPIVDAPAVVLARWRSQPPDVIIGDGGVAYAAAAGYAGRIVAPPPLAPIIARVAIDRARRGDLVGPAGVRPLYVRRPDAELAREAR